MEMLGVVPFQVTVMRARRVTDEDRRQVVVAVGSLADDAQA